MTKANKILFGIIGVAILAAGAVYLFRLIDRGPDIAPEVIDAFQDELIDRALARGPHPIEGFDAFMLLERFPGLEEADFDGVQSGGLREEGLYFYADGKLQWKRTTSQPISTAEKTILNEGYKTLLENLSRRLGTSVSSTEETFAIIDAIEISKNDLALNCKRDIPVTELDTTLDPERKIVIVRWWDGERQENIELVLSYSPETDFEGCSESAKRVLRHIQQIPTP